MWIEIAAEDPVGNCNNEDNHVCEKVTAVGELLCGEAESGRSKMLGEGLKSGEADWGYDSKENRNPSWGSVSDRFSGNKLDIGQLFTTFDIAAETYDNATGYNC